MNITTYPNRIKKKSCEGIKADILQNADIKLIIKKLFSLQVQCCNEQSFKKYITFEHYNIKYLEIEI